MAGADQAKVELAKLIEQEGWILAEEQFFGRKGSMYDFTNIVPLELYEDVQKMEERRDQLRKKFNPNVNELFEKNSQWREDLERKRQITKDDKDKIQRVINELDRERNQDIKKTVKEVDRSFGEIFSVLFPNTWATLQPVYDKDDSELLTGL